MEFRYVAYTGERKLIKGKISAISEKVAVQALVDAGYRIASMKPATSFLPSLNVMLTSGVKIEEMVLFSRQLALLTESGIGVIQGLELLGQQATNGQLKKVLAAVVDDLKSGATMSACLGKHPRLFSHFYSRMVAVGEQTGDLGPVLRSLADYMEREAAAMSKLRTALTYPVIVTALGLFVVILLIKVALPPLLNLFTSFKADLPLPTRILLATVGFSNNYGQYVLLGLAAAVIITLLYFRTPPGRLLRDRTLLAMPVLGRLLLLTELARACRTMALLFRSGLPLPEIMALTRRASSNRVVADALGTVQEAMIKGEGLSKPMSRQSVFLPLMVAMTRVGEEVGNLDETMMTVAQNYDAESATKMNTALALVEPVMMILMGAGVGFIALSVFMPMYSILGSVGGK